jgi:hypothetical protein
LKKSKLTCVLEGAEQLVHPATQFAVITASAQEIGLSN